jgi:quinol monooxygenase YgiN
MFTYIWEYFVNEECRSEFEQAYGSDGDWVMLFSKADGYLGTELHQDISNLSRYITIDHWISIEARDNFRKQFAKEFDAIDQRCEQFTEKEVFIGDFGSLGNRK